jgi:hypothetical protein
MLKCDGSEPESQTCADDNQQDTANQAIPAMAAGRTAPDNDLDAPCFRLIRQLLPTFNSPAWDFGPNTLPCTVDAIRVPLPIA